MWIYLLNSPNEEPQYRECSVVWHKRHSQTYSKQAKVREDVDWLASEFVGEGGEERGAHQLTHHHQGLGKLGIGCPITHKVPLQQMVKIIQKMNYDAAPTSWPIMTRVREN